MDDMSIGMMVACFGAVILVCGMLFVVTITIILALLDVAYREDDHNG